MNASLGSYIMLTKFVIKKVTQLANHYPKSKHQEWYMP